MAKEKERIIYDNWDYDYVAEEQEAKEFLKDCYNMDEEEITDEDIQREVWDHLDQCWETEKEMLENHFKKFEYGFLVTTSLGRWNGIFAGGDILKDWNEIQDKCLSDYDGIRLYDVDGHFFIEGIHHDGRDRFEVKALTKKGFELVYDYWEYGDYYGKAHTEQEFHNMLFGNNFYTKLIHFAHEVYGCPKREVA